LELFHCIKVKKNKNGVATVEKAPEK